MQRSVMPNLGSEIHLHRIQFRLISGQSIFGFIKSFGSSLDQLALRGEDDPTIDDLGDQIKATALIPDTHLIPGLWKIDGYTGISKTIQKNFIVMRGQPDDPSPANYYEFPYDWRRDNRVASRHLKDLIERQLPVWRAFRNAPDAKVIIMAHSMGGLLARHYLEVMEGWPNCRLLVTFGTPYRGALDYLANGYKNVLLFIGRGGACKTSFCCNMTFVGAETLCVT